MVRKNPQSKEVNIIDVSKSDIDHMRENLKQYVQKEINGKLQRRFDQYCKTIGILSFNEYGEVIIHNAPDYHRLNQIHDKLQAIDSYSKPPIKFSKSNIIKTMS